LEADLATALIFISVKLEGAVASMACEPSLAGR
jgi:hypothetical protein